MLHQTLFYPLHVLRIAALACAFFSARVFHHLACLVVEAVGKHGDPALFMKFSVFIG